MILNCLSGGVCSSAMSLLYPKIPNVVINTGGNYDESWNTIYQLQKKGLKILVISSFQQGYPTYYDYIKNDKIPFYKSCSHKAKQIHFNKLASIFRPVTYNIGFTKDEEHRIKEYKNSPKHVKYNYPLIKYGYTREDCLNLLKKNNIDARKSGCWFCCKQPKESWLWLKENHIEKYNEAIKKGWYKE